MSLDLYLAAFPCEKCGHHDESKDFNITYNLAPMWYQIFPNHRKMIPIEGMTGAQALPIIEHALSCLLADPDRFKAFNPANGWGNYDDFVTFLSNLKVVCLLHPEKMWRAAR